MLSHPLGSSASSTTRIGKPSLILKHKAQRSHSRWSFCSRKRVLLGLRGQRNISRKSWLIILPNPRKAQRWFPSAFIFFLLRLLPPVRFSDRFSRKGRRDTATRAVCIAA